MFGVGGGGGGGGGGGLCDYCVSPSPFGLDFGTLDFGTSDLGLTILYMSFSIKIRHFVYIEAVYVCLCLSSYSRKNEISLQITQNMIQKRKLKHLISTYF